MDEAPRERHVDALDGLRAFAVLAVIAFHARPGLFPGGYIGVDVFFVLSGFLITAGLLREASTHGGIDIMAFYLRRVFRLAPAMLLTCGFVLVAWGAGWTTSLAGQTLQGALTAVTQSSSFFLTAGADLGWMTHTWSLSVEEWFYLAWPFMLVFLISVGRRHLATWMVSIAAAAVLWRFFLSFSGVTIGRLSYGLDTRAEQLLIGGVLALLILRGLRGRSIMVAVSLVCLVAVTIAPPDFAGVVYRHGGSTLVAALAGLAILGATTAVGPMVRVLAWRPFVWIGRRSYGIYLWNLPVVGLLQGWPLSASSALVVKLGLSFAIPALSYRLIEKPALRRGRRFIETRGQSRRWAGGDQGTRVVTADGVSREG